MKKYLITSLLALVAAFSFTAIACKDDPAPNSGVETPDNGDNGDNGEINGGEENPTPSKNTYTVTLNGGEGYTIVGDGVQYDKSNGVWKATVTEGATFTFSVELGAFYTGVPTVAVNNVAIPDTNGKFNVKIDANTNVVIGGVFKDVSVMQGTGAFDDAYVVSRPIDLVYIAEQVNAGKGNYATASYVLAADIDFKGEEIDVIGTEEHPFSGCFTCLTDSETGAMERFVISNFKINATDKNYVGLFGCVQVDMSVSSSGLFYGIRIADFEINAAAANLPKYGRNLYCGGLIGYGIGTRAYLCDATNGIINISADPSEFSFAGGLIGVQQSMYMVEYNQYYNAETAYANVNVDVNVVSGTALYAGGIAGYLITNSFGSPSYIHNSYATGNVSGAIRSGGIAGGLGQYASIATCYSTGNVSARSDLTSQTDGYMAEHCLAYAGGIVGFAENDSVVNNCFALGKLTAKAVDGASAQFTHYTVGGGDEDGKVSVASRKYVVLECLGALDKATMPTTLSEMGWQSYNWIITNTDYPTINYEASSESVTVTGTVEFVDRAGNSVNVDKAPSTSYSYTDTYAPIASAFVDGQLGLYYTADDKKSLSFGYYFDKACTQPVPYSFITTKNVTLYVGFEDPEAIVGEYYLAIHGKEKPLTISILKDGTVLCADGDTVTEAYYQYDGATLLIEGARLARYFTGEVDDEQSVNEDTLFDLNRYTSYYFQVKQTDFGIELFDGTYFTESAPLKAYAPTAFDKLGAYYTQEGNERTEYVFYADGTATKDGESLEYAYVEGIVRFSDNTSVSASALTAYDSLKGKWQKSAFVSSVFDFDGAGTWKSYALVYTRDLSNGSYAITRENQATGTYETADGLTYTLTLQGSTVATATLENGFLSITYMDGVQETYSKDSSLVGEWQSGDTVLRLNGINAAGEGTATIEFKSLKVVYDLTYTESETSGYLCLYYEDTPFGYFAHNPLTNTLQATIYDPTGMDNGYFTASFSLVNDFHNVWISNNETFDNISFNGVGSYNSNGDFVGTLTIDGTRVNYTLTNGGLDGYFSYQGTQYLLHYDDLTGEITVDIDPTNNADDITLERKDSLADVDFVHVDSNNQITSFAFNGKSNLINGGEMTVTLADETTTNYLYKSLTNGNFLIYDANADLTVDAAIGSIVKDAQKACYIVTIGATSYDAYIRNEFIGSWALSSRYEKNAFIIGATDLDGYIHANFLGEPVKIQKLETDFYTFDCELDGMPTTYYLYVLYDNETGKFDSFALSEYTSLIFGDYILCSYVDLLQGTWQQNNSSFSLSFDGVQSSFSNGTAVLSYSGYDTPYYYRIYTDNHGKVEAVMLWSQKTYNNKTLYYKLIPTETTTEGAFVLGDKAYLRVEIDSLFMMEAIGVDGYTYKFDGGNINSEQWGTLTATKEGEEDRTLRYNIEAFNEDYTVTITVKETVDGEEKTYTATLDYSNNNNLTLTFVEKSN